MARFTGLLDQPLVAVTVDCTLGPVEAILTQPSVTGATTIAAGSDGAVLPVTTLNVASTIGTGADEPFATSGVVFVESTLNGAPSIAAVTYTGKTNTSFTGCTGGTGVLATGGTVTGNHLVAWAGVDRWLTSDGNPPVLASLANAVDHLFFDDIGGAVYGRHKNGPGVPGGPGSAGPVGMQNRGTYAPATAYVLNDVVAYLGSTYICIQAGTGHTPTTLGTAYWDVMALAGAPPPPIIIIDPDPPGTPGTSLDTKGIAGQIINWTRLQNMTPLTSAQLGYIGNATPGLGIKGLILQQNFLHNLGAFPDVNWTGNPATNLNLAGYEQQKLITNGNWVANAHAAGIDKLYLGCYSVNYNNTQTPFVDWFNDNPGSGWQDLVLANISNWAGAAKLMGMTGVAFDCEPYSVVGAKVPTWDWNIYGGGHGGESGVRAKMFQRGQQMMQTILAAYGPGVELVFYHLFTDGSISSILQHKVNGYPLNVLSVNQGLINYFDGMTSVPGYSRIRLLDAQFFFGSGLAGADNATAMCINANGILAYLSQNLSNWAYASSRVSITPFTWFGPTTGNEAPTSALQPSGAGYTDDDLVADARKYAMSGFIGNYDSGGPVPPNHAAYIDYSSPNGHISHKNFEPVYAAVVPGIVDTSDPTLGSIVITRDNATTVHATGTATDNLGVRAIRWFCGPSAGAAVHTFVPEQTRTDTPSTGPQAGIGAVVPDYTVAVGSFTFHHTWVANGIPATAGQTIIFDVEDIKGRVASYTRTAPA